MPEQQHMHTTLGPTLPSKFASRLNSRLHAQYRNVLQSAVEDKYTEGMYTLM